MGTPVTPVTPEKLERFLEKLMECGNVSEAAKYAKMARKTVYAYRKADDQFASAFDEARAIGLEALEDEANRRAFRGVLEPVFYKGQKCATVRKYSDTLLIFLLKGGKPDKYRENASVDVTSKGEKITPAVFYIPKPYDPSMSELPTED